jgi:hypothetical protein
MQKPNKKPKREKQKTQENNNPFDDIFFWLTLATTDYSWLFEENNEGTAALDINGKNGSK